MQYLQKMVKQGHSQGALGKRSSKIDPFTPLILRIFCIYLTLFNIIIPKIFQPHFAWHNFIPLLDFLFMHIQNFCWGLQGNKKSKSFQGPKAGPGPQPIRAHFVCTTLLCQVGKKVRNFQFGPPPFTKSWLRPCNIIAR